MNIYASKSWTNYQAQSVRQTNVELGQCLADQSAVEKFTKTNGVTVTDSFVL